MASVTPEYLAITLGFDTSWLFFMRMEIPVECIGKEAVEAILETHHHNREYQQLAQTFQIG